MARRNGRQGNVLDPERVVRTLIQLQDRIAERFPGAGLVRVCGDLTDTARKTQKRAAVLGRPYFGLRLLVVLIVIAAVLAQAYLVRLADWGALQKHDDAVGLTQGLDSAVHLAILAFAAIWSLATFETRLKRGRTLRYLYELRAFAHVIDMHQLTKDPSTILQFAHRSTASSPPRPMNEFQLARYLDYCSEMLALTSKLAALYAANSRDAEVMDAVNDVEVLTSDLGRKIWQKITILSRFREAEEATA